MYQLVEDLKINKASGPDNILCRILKESAQDLSPTLITLFYQSLETEELLDD